MFGFCPVRFQSSPFGSVTVVDPRAVHELEVFPQLPNQLVRHHTVVAARVVDSIVVMTSARQLSQLQFYSVRFHLYVRVMRRREGADVPVRRRSPSTLISSNACVG
jgi:hypothetical protein